MRAGEGGSGGGPAGAGPHRFQPPQTVAAEATHARPAPMSKTLAPGPCPFMAQLVGLLLSNEPGALGRETMFSHLIELERQARLHDASRATQALIARVRRIAGTARIIPFPRLAREGVMRETGHGFP